MVEEKREGVFFLNDFKKMEIPTAVAVFPAEMSELGHLGLMWIEFSMSLNGQRCQVVVILLRWSNQIFLINDLVSFSRASSLTKYFLNLLKTFFEILISFLRLFFISIEIYFALDKEFLLHLLF